MDLDVFAKKVNQRLDEVEKALKESGRLGLSTDASAELLTLCRALVERVEDLEKRTLSKDDIGQIGAAVGKINSLPVEDMLAMLKAFQANGQTFDTAPAVEAKGGHELTGDDPKTPGGTDLAQKGTASNDVSGGGAGTSAPGVPGAAKEQQEHEGQELPGAGGRA